VAFAEAEEDLMIKNNPRIGLDENGKIATAQNQLSPSHLPLQSLDEEYTEVRRLL